MSAPSDGLERSLIQVLHNTTDECGEPGWLTFNDLLVKVSGAHFSPVEEDDFGNDSANFIDLAEQLLEQAVADGLIEKYETKSVRETPLKLSSQGAYQASGFDQLAIEEEPEAEEAPFKTFDSSAWTGLKLRQDQIDDALAEIEALERKVESLKLDNIKRCQALALLGATKTLLGAPEPPLDIIRMILLNFDRIIGIAGFMIGWISLVQSWTA